MPESVRITGLRHAYGATPVLAGLDLSVGEGELVAILGASGCGKTTLLRAIAGLVTPTDGDIHIAGQAVVQGGRDLVPCERRGVGLVFQEYALFPTLTVSENIGFGGASHDRVQKLLAVTGLDDLADRKPSQLSGGQQQRVALARALAPKPTLILLDEPFANVDAQRRLALGRFLREALAVEGTAALLVTHDQDTALRLGDRLAVLMPGPAGARVAQQGAPQEVYREPVSLEVARLTGSCFEVDGQLCRPEELGFVVGDGADEVVAAAFVGRCWSLLVRTADGEVEVESAEHRPPGTRGRLQRS